MEEENKILSLVLNLKTCVVDDVVHLLSRVQLFSTPWTAAHQASLSFTISQSLLKFMSTESTMSSNHLILCQPFFCPQSFPASGSFPVNWLLASGSQRIRASASASVLLSNEYSGLISFRIDWFDLQIHFCQGCHAQSCTRAWQET